VSAAASLDEIPAFLDRRKLVYTFTNLQAYRNCAHAMYRRYLKKDIPYVETPEMKWGNDVHSAFEHRISSNRPLPITMQQWEKFATPYDGRAAIAEQKLGITKAGRTTGYWDSDCWFRGRVDLSILSQDRAFINDYKTGGSKYEDPFELEVGALLLKAKYPELTIIKGTYTWLKENRVGQLYDLSRFRDTWNEINRIIGKIEADNEFEKHQSGLCGWCDVRDCEHNRKRS
jgi:hypothetical protein